MPVTSFNRPAVAGRLTEQLERDLLVSGEIHETGGAGRPPRRRVREQAMVLAQREL